ncbi:hypothetical protein LINPERPRIM_LOCUS37617, partial [Linum perenne]
STQQQPSLLPAPSVGLVIQSLIRSTDFVLIRSIVNIESFNRQCRCFVLLDSSSLQLQFSNSAVQTMDNGSSEADAQSEIPSRVSVRAKTDPAWGYAQQNGTKITCLLCSHTFAGGGI